MRSLRSLFFVCILLSLCMLVRNAIAQHPDDDHHHSAILTVINHTHHHLEIEIDGRDVGHVEEEDHREFSVSTGHHELKAHTANGGETWGPKHVDIGSNGYRWTLTEH